MGNYNKNIIISIFKEDNVFSMNANLTYCSPLNIDTDFP